MFDPYYIPSRRPSGIKNTFEVWRDCEECDGSGYVINQICPDCEGSGGVEIGYYESDTCYLCSGTGKKDHKAICPVCHGQGGAWELDMEE